MKSRPLVAFVLVVLSLVLAPVPGRADRWHAMPVAVQLPGDTANATSSNVRINSLDGRYALFQSGASHLVAGQVDDNDVSDVFLHDRVAGTTQLVSGALGSTTVVADAGSTPDAISADGRFVVLTSNASNLVAGVTGDTAFSTQLYLFDRVAGTATLVSHRFDSPTLAATGNVGAASISGDGQWVVYTSNSTDMINGSISGRNVFLFDRITGTNVLVSRSAASSTTGGNNVSGSPRISADGRWIAFESTANNLLASDTNGSPDVFLFDRFAGTISLVSRQAGTSTTPATRDSYVTAISPDGRWVLFSSLATNLVAGVTDNALRFDVFVYDRTTGSTILASRPAGSTTTTPNGQSLATGISDDGARVIFDSDATDLGFTDSNGASASAYVFDRNTAATTLVSRQRGTTTVTAAGFATPNAISPDGQMIVFTSNGDDLVNGIEDANATSDVFLFNMATGITTLVSQAGSAARTGSSVSRNPSLGSGWIAFESEAQDLLDGLADRNASSDVFLRAPTGVQTLLSAGIGTPQTTLGAGSGIASTTGEARYVSYSTTDSNVVAGATDLNRVSDAFFFDRQTTTTSLVSSATGAPTTAANALAESGPTSLDGRWVLYTSQATNGSFGQVEFNTASDVFLLDRTTGASVLVSRSTTATNWTGNGASTAAELSADGRYAVFTSSATDLVAGITDSNGKVDAFVFDRDTRVTTLVSRTSAGTSTPDGTSVADAISPDGRWILYTFSFQPPFGPARSDLHLFDRETATTTLVSHQPGMPTQSAGGSSRDGFLSTDGQWVLFTSTSTLLIANGTDNNAASDVFLFARSTGIVTLVSHAFGFASTAAGAPSTAAGLSADGRWAVLHSGASNIAAGVVDANGAGVDAFVFDRTTGTSALVTRAMGTSDTTPNDAVTRSVISGDGRWIAFSSRASNIVTETDANGAGDTFVFDRATGTTSLVSRAAAMTDTANSETAPTAIGEDGRWLLLSSLASNLGVRDVNGRYDAYLAEHRFDVVATAGPNGSIAPPGASGVPLGTSAAFTIAPAAHYGIQSVTGCGGALAGQSYATGPVDADCTVTAAFGNTPPTIGTVADVTVFEDSGTQTRAVTVADAETPLASLSLAAASAQPATLPAPTVGAGATAGQRAVAFAPAANRNGGPIAITLTLSDVPGASTTGTFAVTITPVNDAPTLAFAADPRHPQGTIGAQSRAAFAGVDLGPDDEDANQSVEDFQIVAISDQSGILVPASLDIANNGTLGYTLTGASGTASVQANVRDDAGSQNGGQSVSATEVFSVVVEGSEVFANGFE